MIGSVGRQSDIEFFRADQMKDLILIRLTLLALEIEILQLNLDDIRYGIWDYKVKVAHYSMKYFLKSAEVYLIMNKILMDKKY